MKSANGLEKNGIQTQSKDDGKIWPQVVTILIACLAPLTNGLLYTWSSPFIVQITKDKVNYDISEDEASYFAFIPAIGMVIFCFPFSKISDCIGRKRTLLLVAIPHVLSWTLIAVARNVYVFYAARLCSGIGDAGLFSALPVYVGEVTTPKVRGTWGNGMTFAIYLGQLLINVLGNLLNVKQTAYICVALPIIFAVLFSFMPESPYFYIMKGRLEEAKNSLRWLRGKENVDEEFKSLKADVERQISESGTWRDLFTIESNRKALIAGLFLRISQQLGGMAVFSVYAQYIFEKAGGNLSSATSTIIYASLCLVLNFAAGFTVERLGRRISYIGSLILCSFVLFLESAYFFIDQYHPELDLSGITIFPIIGMFLFIIFSSFGLAIIPTLMLGELFSASIKAKGLTLLSLSLAVFQFMASNVFYLLSANVGFYSPFLLFSICTFVSFILAIFYVPETKGKTLEEIQQSLKKKKKENV